jgi:hypothetical protein
MFFEKLALARIEEAMQSGEFDNLPGRGKPIDLSDYFSAPEELRAAYGILRNAGVLPQEAQLLKDVRELEDELARCGDERSRCLLRRAIEEKWVNYRILTERYHTKRRRER